MLHTKGILCFSDKIIEMGIMNIKETMNNFLSFTIPSKVLVQLKYS